MLKKLSCLVAVMLIASATALAADVDLKDVKCVVAAKAADASKSADYKDGKVYFCCGGCLSKFTESKKKFAVKANHQLVATKQYEQTKCPISGGPINTETAMTVAGTKIAFCCSHCKTKVESAESDEAKLKIVFNEKSFKKAFAKVKKEKTK